MTDHLFAALQIYMSSLHDNQRSEHHYDKDYHKFTQEQIKKITDRLNTDLKLNPQILPPHSADSLV